MCCCWAMLVRTTRIFSEEVFRGAALADDVAPFVVINDNDAVPARAFTLVHELAHIWIGASGVSGPLQEISDNMIERFCNDVAGEFLLPSTAVPDMSYLRGAACRGRSPGDRARS